MTLKGVIGAGLLSALGAGMALAQDEPNSFFGNVRASDISSLSYEVRGCIVEVSETAERDRVVEAGQVVVRLDDLRAKLALRTAEVRVLELEAAVAERQLALQSAQADESRQQHFADGQDHGDRPPDPPFAPHQPRPFSIAKALPNASTASAGTTMVWVPCPPAIREMPFTCSRAMLY